MRRKPKLVCLNTLASFFALSTCGPFGAQDGRMGAQARAMASRQRGSAPVRPAPARRRLHREHFQALKP